MQTSLIIKELTKQKNRFNRKVFHNRENSENRFSEFSYFMKCFKEYVSWTFIGIVKFHEMFERNISQCILAFRKFLKGNAQFIFLCNPQKSGSSRVFITFPQVTRKILTKDIFHSLEVITEILSFYKDLVWEKQPLTFLKFSKNLQKIDKKKLYSWYILGL